MKLKSEELWVQNPGTSDISLSELGVKVPAGKTINVFKWNPYLTVVKVQESLDRGSLLRRLTSKALKVVRNKPTAPALNKLKVSKEAVLAKKTKTSVVLETQNDELEEDGSFGFADYGISDLGPSVSQKRDGAVVVVEAAQDELPSEESDTELKPVLKKPDALSHQSVITMETQAKSASNPMGKLANQSMPSAQQPFTVVQPPEKEPEEAQPPTPVVGFVKEGDTVTTNIGKVAGQRSIKAAKELNDVAEKLGLDSAADLPSSMVEAYDADQVIVSAPTEFDTRVATRTKDGATVMKLKEEPVKEPKQTKTKAKPVKKTAKK